MITADLGSKTTELLMKEIRRGVTEGKINHTNEVMGYIEEYVTKILEDQEETLEMHSPEVILVVGVNGVGKTTTIAKLAHYYKEAGKKLYWQRPIHSGQPLQSSYQFGQSGLMCPLLNIRKGLTQQL